MAGLVPFNRRNLGVLGTGFGDLHNMLDDFFTETWLPGRSLMRDTFKVDVEEADNKYLIHAELPGIQKDEVTIDMNDGRLSISVNKAENINAEKKNYLHRERRFTSMCRSIYLADSKASDIKAKLENGVLTLTVPKHEKQVSTIKIDVE